MAIPKYTRREFCAQSTAMLSFGALTAAIAGCGGSPTNPTSGFPALSTVNATAGANNTATVTVAGTALADVGGAALVNASGRSFLVAQTATNTFSALTSTCTHEGCTVNTYQNSVYECTCHGSQYSTSGAVLRGPASAPLRQFATSFAGGVLTMTTA
jgi:cytochrome b6-f complex iron-sulfur subunit